MNGNQGLLAVKLYEMEQQYGRLQSRLRICCREDREKLRQELERAREEYQENAILLDQRVRGSRCPAVAELARAQQEYCGKSQALLRDRAHRYFHAEGCTPGEDEAEAAALYAEYAIDFATQSMQYAMLTALTAMDLQLNLESQKEESQL